MPRLQREFHTSDSASTSCATRAPGVLKTRPAFITLSVIIQVYFSEAQRLPSGSYEACVDECTLALSQVKVRTPAVRVPECTQPWPRETRAWQLVRLAWGRAPCYRRQEPSLVDKISRVPPPRSHVLISHTFYYRRPFAVTIAAKPFGLF